MSNEALYAGEYGAGEVYVQCSRMDMWLLVWDCCFVCDDIRASIIVESEAMG